MKLDDWMTKREKSTRWLAEAAGVSLEMARLLRKGRRRPGSNTAIRIYKATNGEVDPVSFLDLPVLEIRPDRAA